MTANADHFDLGPTAEMWDASDDLDLGFDQLISRYATHRLHDAAALARLRPDLARLIAPPEVTFAAYLADGTIVLCCPDGIPESLADAVDLLDPSDPVPPAAAAQPTQTFVPPVDLAERLDILSQKLDVLQRDQTVGGQIADRLDEVKTALVDGLAKATTRVPAADAVAEGADPQMLAAELLGSIEQMLQQSEQRVLTFMRHANRTPALAPQIDGIEQGLRQIVAATADQPLIRDSLVRLHEQIDGLIARPMPTVDLSIQRQGIAHFLESMGTVIRRLDASIDRLDRPSSPQADPQLTDIANHLTVMVQQLDDLGTAKIDLSPMTRALCDLRAEISRSAQTIQPTTDAVEHLAQRIDALALRPDPVLDLTQQRQSFAHFGEAMAQVLRRLEGAATVFASQPDTARILATTEALRNDLEIPLAQTKAQSQAIEQLTALVTDLANRPGPTLDLTAQRTAFAQFATVIAQTLRRLEAHGAKQDAHARDLHAIAAQAILGMMHSQTIGVASQTTVATDAASARTALAEAMAKEFMTRGWQPVSVD